MERLYEHHIQTQLQLIDEQHLVEKYERGQREAAQQQLALFKEARVKSEQQRKEAAAAAATALQTSSIVVQIDGQPTLLQLSDAAIQPQANTTAANVAATASLTDNTTELIVPGKRLYIIELPITLFFRIEYFKNRKCFVLNTILKYISI